MCGDYIAELEHQISELTKERDSLLDDLMRWENDYSELWSKYDDIEHIYRKIHNLPSYVAVDHDNILKAVEYGAICMNFDNIEKFINILKSISELNIENYTAEISKLLESLDTTKYNKYTTLLSSIYPIQVVLEISQDNIEIKSVKGNPELVPLIKGMIKYETLNKI